MLGHCPDVRGRLLSNLIEMNQIRNYQMNWMNIYNVKKKKFILHVDERGGSKRILMNRRKCSLFDDLGQNRPKTM